MENKPRRRSFIDRRARRLAANSVATGVAAAFPLLGVASYSITAPELGTPGWTLISIGTGLTGVSMACLAAAFSVQAGADREEAAVTAAASAASEAVTVRAGKLPPPPPNPVHQPAPPVPPLVSPGTYAFLPPDQRPVNVVLAETPAPAVSPQPVSVDPGERVVEPEPAHVGDLP